MILNDIIVDIEFMILNALSKVILDKERKVETHQLK